MEKATKTEEREKAVKDTGNVELQDEGDELEDGGDEECQKAANKAEHERKEFGDDFAMRSVTS